VGTRVLTSYGSGVIASYRESDDMYEVKLPFARAFVKAGSIIGAEQLNTAALAAIGVSKGGVGKPDIIWNGLVTGDPNFPTVAASFLQAAHTNSSSLKHHVDVVSEPGKVFFGTQMCYVFLRLHHTLFTRLREVKLLAQEMEQTRMLHHLGGAQSAGSFGNYIADPTYVNSPSKTGLHGMYAADSQAQFTSLTNSGNSHASRGGGGPNHPFDDDGGDHSHGGDVPLYNAFLGQVLALVEGSIDNVRFEEFCRSLLGNKAYVLFTLDKIISQLMKHLQAMANNDTVMKLIGLFMYHHRHRFHPSNTHQHQHQSQQQKEQHQSQNQSPPVLDTLLYRNHVAQILSHTMEDVFRLQLLCPVEGICADCSEVAVQQLGILSSANSAQDTLSAAFNAAPPSTAAAPSLPSSVPMITASSALTSALPVHAAAATAATTAAASAAARSAVSGGVGSRSAASTAMAVDDDSSTTIDVNAAPHKTTALSTAEYAPAASASGAGNNLTNTNTKTVAGNKSTGSTATTAATTTAAATAAATTTTTTGTEKTTQVTTSKGRRFALTLSSLSHEQQQQQQQEQLNNNESSVKTPKAAVESDTEDEDEDEDEEANRGGGGSSINISHNNNMRNNRANGGRASRVVGASSALNTNINSSTMDEAGSMDLDNDDEEEEEEEDNEEEDGDEDNDEEEEDTEGQMLVDDDVGPANAGNYRMNYDEDNDEDASETGVGNNRNDPTERKIVFSPRMRH
jgi:hypothetical protein